MLRVTTLSGGSSPAPTHSALPNEQTTLHPLHMDAMLLGRKRRSQKQTTRDARYTKTLIIVPSEKSKIAAGVGLTDGWNSGDDLSKLQLIQDGRLTRGIETDHENAHLPLGEQFLKQLGESEPHLVSSPRIMLLFEKLRATY